MSGAGCGDTSPGEQPLEADLAETLAPLRFSFSTYKWAAWRRGILSVDLPSSP